jgi:phospholipid transport system substrate-binding protein
MSQIRKFILCAFVFLLPYDIAAASTCPAENYIQSAGEAFMNASRRGTGAAFSTAASRYADLHGLALFALGNFRKYLPKSRETEYVARTRTFMGNFMAEYGSKFAGNSIAVTSCNEAAGGLTVGTKLSTGQVIVFRLQKTGGSYRVKDVSVSAIWLAQTMRNKFTRIIKENNGDVEALISYLGK